MAKNKPFSIKVFMPPSGTATVAFVLTKDLKFTGWVPLTDELVSMANQREFFYMKARWSEKDDKIADGMLALLEEETNKHW